MNLKSIAALALTVIATSGVAHAGTDSKCSTGTCSKKVKSADSAKTDASCSKKAAASAKKDGSCSKKAAPMTKKEASCSKKKEASCSKKAQSNQ